jgi:hypothetical protein
VSRVCHYTLMKHKKHCESSGGAYKRPDLRCSFRGLGCNKRRGSREFPGDGLGLALANCPSRRRPDGCRRLLLAADPEGRGTQPWPGPWNGGTGPEGCMAVAAPSLEHLNSGRREGDGGSHGLAATSTPIKWISQT